MIIPRPNHIELGKTIYNVNRLLIHNKTSMDFTGILSKINEKLSKNSGEAKKLYLFLDPSTNGYEINLSEEIRIKGSTQENILYGLISLYQLVLQDTYLLEQRIIDYPSFSWRGMMLDVSRHFFSKELILKIIDLLVLHKLNILHLHLSDDHGFRIESKKYPKLTEISTKRKGSHFNKNTESEGEYSGFYTQEDIREIISYAHQNCIRVIPEIDIPGHITAILAAYPELSCLEEKKQVATGIGYYQTSLCMSNRNKVNFILDIIEEIAELFPDKIIHFGGDEVSLKKSHNCPSCRKIIENNSNDDKILFKMLFSEIRERFIPKGYTIINWNDLWPYIDSSGKNHYTQIWSFINSRDLYKKIPNNYSYSINSNSRYFYADYSYRVIELKSTYNYDITKGVTDTQYVLGGEMPLWTEYIDNEKKLFLQLLPRLTAFSENLWTRSDKKNYNNFIKNKAFITNLYNSIGIQEYTPFNRVSARILRGDFLYPIRMLFKGLQLFGIKNLLQFVIKGELPFDDPSEVDS